MKKSLLPLLLIAGLASGCATTSTLSTKDNVSVAKVKLDSVNVNLNQKYDNPVFYSQADIEQYLSKCLVAELSKEGKYQTNAKASVNINIDYRRIYSGEAFGMQKSIGSPEIAYSYKVISDNKILQQNEEKELFVNAGLLGNFNYVGNTEKEDENMYIDALCRHIAQKIY
ncbi:hypothetical protein [Psychrobacter fozii]|uniref:Lipoprotein n=1 Tax=Psychrobacter fozii TaxID=198480 RepID=A0A2V4VGV3_9GAMM|nr:hypothetical protein [Psychrobacter fozii]PYE38005.1 hypothetical protein DFP82_11086 [Psychrobacter fozii]